MCEADQAKFDARWTVLQITLASIALMAATCLALAIYITSVITIPVLGVAMAAIPILIVKILTAVIIVTAVGLIVFVNAQLLPRAQDMCKCKVDINHNLDKQQKVDCMELCLNAIPGFLQDLIYRIFAVAAAAFLLFFLAGTFIFNIVAAVLLIAAYAALHWRYQWLDLYFDDRKSDYGRCITIK